jgi:pyruvate/2-oxoglutarate dehydrogenase complex dihydrolipoamide dehydrogenase (E3) component
MTILEQYDAIIVGAGQAGGPLASALADAGLKTAIVEQRYVGGTCVNDGCTPTKTMIASARVAYLARRAADYGIHTGPIAVDMAKVRQRKQDIVDSFREGSQNRLENTDGLDLVMGQAQFKGHKIITVRLNGGGTRHLTADKIFINTGARPRIPSFAGLDGVAYLDSTSIMDLDKVPEHLLILGGGYIGLEFGQMFRRFGSQVTIIQRRGQVLTREDPDVAEGVAEILRGDGIDLLLETQPLRTRKTTGDQVALDVRSPEGERTLVGSHLLVAAGRVPNTGGLNLAATGLEADKRGSIQVNDRLETQVAGVYALGDVNGGPAFTHVSYDDFRIIRANLLEDGDATTIGRPVPYVVFIDPQLGRVGLTEKDAKAQKLPHRVAKIPMAWVARGLEMDETRGFMKAIVDAETNQILGAAILGVEGGEVMTVIQMAMMGNIPYTALRDTVFAHPTLSESLNNLFAAMDG